MSVSPGAVQEIVERAEAAERALAPRGLGEGLRERLPERVRARFADVDTWVFDLDNTLYPAGSPV